MPGSFCWADLITPDQERAKTFYEGLFGWKLKPGQGEECRLPAHRERRRLYRWHPARGTRDPKRPPHWLLYFAVADVDETFRESEGHEAQQFCSRPMDFEGVGRVAMLADPQGAVFALFREMGK